MTNAEALGRVLAGRRMPPAGSGAAGAPSPIDGERLARERHARLQAEMARQGVDLALLLHGPNVSYATGLVPPARDGSHAVFRRPVALVVAGADRPHLLAAGPGDGAGGLPVELHAAAVWPELDEGAARLGAIVAGVAGSLAGRQVAVDEMTGAMLRTGVLAGAEVVDGSHLVGAAKLCKTTDELACLAAAQRLNEEAMLTVARMTRPGARRSQVAGAFLARLAELGCESNLIDPIFQPVPPTLDQGPRTTMPTVAFPTGVGDPTFATGDLVWVDTGIGYLGYASDFGRTWVVGREPTGAEVSLFERWCEVVLRVLEVLAPGATGGDLCRAAEAANGGDRPWLPHFYLAHGVGVESAEMPLVGTDLGRDFDDQLVLAPGMVLVLEPVTWTDGVGGYRAEETVAVTEDGWCHLGGGHPFTPFGS